MTCLRECALEAEASISSVYGEYWTRVGVQTCLRCHKSSITLAGPSLKMAVSTSAVKTLYFQQEMWKLCTSIILCTAAHAFNCRKEGDFNYWFFFQTQVCDWRTDLPLQWSDAVRCHRRDGPRAGGESQHRSAGRGPSLKHTHMRPNVYLLRAILLNYNKVWNMMNPSHLTCWE